MCIPLLATVVVLTMFLGWAMVNQQHVRASARYVAWRNVYRHWYWPEGFDAQDPDLIDDPNHPGLNAMFFEGEARWISVGGGGGHRDEFERLIDAAAEQSAFAGSFADYLLLNPLPDRGRFAHARRATVRAEFDTDVEAFRKYSGAIRSGHIRDGVEWRRNQANCRHVTREMFLTSLEDVLNGVNPPGEGLAARVRGLYHHGW